MKVRMLFKVILGTAVLVGGLAAPAVAGSWTHVSMTGIVNVSGATISLKDNGNDSRFVSTDFRYSNGSQTSGLSNKLGYGTTTSATVTSNITNDRVCASNVFPLPMDCGSWKF